MFSLSGYSLSAVRCPPPPVVIILLPLKLKTRYFPKYRPCLALYNVPAIRSILNHNKLIPRTDLPAKDPINRMPKVCMGTTARKAFLYNDYSIFISKLLIPEGNYLAFDLCRVFFNIYKMWNCPQ